MRSAVQAAPARRTPARRTASIEGAMRREASPRLTSHPLREPRPRRAGAPRDPPLPALAAQGGGDHLGGLLADLPADEGLALVEQARHVRALRPLDSARAEPALEA